MAKIILNIELDSAKAQSGLDDLKKSLTTIADSLGKVKPNKDLTDQIKALSDYYKSLTEAAKKAAEQTQKQADADAKAAINAEKLAKAQHDKEAAASRAKKADEDAAAASARKEAAETRAAEAAEKHAAAQQKRADAAAKAAKKDEEEAKPLWDLEKAYASLYARITSAAEKYPVLADVMGRYGKEVKDTHDALVEYNRGRTDEIEDVDTLTERLKRLSASMASVVADTKEESEAFKSNQQEMDKWAKSVQSAETDVENMRIKLYNMLTAMSSIEGRYPAGTFDILKQAVQACIDGLNSLDKTQENFLDEVGVAKNVIKSVETAFAGVRGEIDHTTPSVDTLGSKFGDLVARYAKFYASSLLVRKPLQMIQDALSDVGETLVETENAVIELNRVLDDPQPAMEAANRLYDIAYQYGSTFENASQIAANFARAGKSWNESLQATEAALLAMNVAELNATEASDGLLSIIAQFDMETSDLIDVVDKLNKTADKNPVSTQKLLQAIQRAGSAAKNANVSFDQTLGLITAISEATNRSGQNIGTAINSLIQYSTKNVDTFATLSKESEEMVDRFKSGLASIVDVWNQVAIDIHNDKEARDNIISALGTDGLEELSSTLHDELGDLVSEIDGVYNVANTYRKNYFIALLDNMDRFATVQEQLTDYQGYSQSENEKYMETYTAKVNQLNDAWKKLANDEQGILGFKKNLVDAGIVLVDIVEKGGGVKTVVAEIVTLLGSVAVFFNGAKIGRTIEGIITTVKQTGEYIKDFGSVWQRYQEASAKAAKAQEVMNALLEQGVTEENAMQIATGGVDWAQKKAAASAAMWQGALGWISLAVTAITLLATGINAVVAAQERSREEAITQGKETAETAKQISELRAAMAKLNPESAEYRETEEKVVELLGDKQILLDGLIKGTEEYTKKVKELTDAELREAQYNAIQAQDAAGKDVKSAIAGYNFSTLVGGYEGPLRSQLISAKSIEDQYKIYQDITKKLIDLKREYVIASTSGDEETAKSIQMSIDYYQKFVDKTGTAFEEWKTAVENNAALARLALDQSIEGISASMLTIPATARKSQEELQAIADETGLTLEEVQAAFEQVGQGTAEALEEIPEQVKDTTAMTADELDAFAEKITGTVGAYSAAASAIELVKEAQKEYAEQGQLSLETVEKLSKLGADWVSVLFDESGAVDVNSEAVGYLVDKYQDWLDASGYLIDTTSEIAEEAKDLSAEIDDVQSSLSFLKSVQEEYNETGSLSIDTLQQLLSLDSEYLDLIIDEEGQINLNKEAVDRLLESKNDLLDELMAEQVQQYAVDRANYYMSKSTEEVAEKTGIAAKGVSVLAATMRMLKGDSIESADALVSAVDEQVEALHRMALSSGFYNEDWEELWVADVQDYTDKLVAAKQALSEELSKSWETSSKSSGSSSSSSGSQKDEVLEGHKDLVSLLESELTLMEHQGKSEEEQIAKIREIQSAIATQADYMRSIGASQEEINKLSSDWWKWEEKINKFAEDRQKAAEKAAEEAEKERKKAEQEAKKAAEEAEKAAKKAEEEAKKAAEEAEKARIKALNDETARHKQVVSDLKAELNLWQKQGKSVSDQVEEMKKIQDGLHEEAEWLRHLQATEKDIKVTQAEIDALSAEWWDWQEKILKLYEDTLKAARDIELEAQQKVIDDLLKSFEDIEASRKEELEINEKILAVEKAREDVTEAIRNAQLDYIKSTLSGYIKSLSDAKTLEEKQNAVIEARKKLVEAEQDARAKAIIDAFKAEKSVKSDALSIEEKRLAVEKARQALIDAENERTTRVYNESSGQWEYQANAKNVQTAQENLQKAVDALNAYVEEQAWKEVSEAVENGSVSEAEVLEILTKWARESYGEGSPEFVAKIQGAFRKAMGTPASPESLSGQVSAVDKAVESLNEYLKQEAVKELEQYIAAGNTDSAGMRSILDKWLSMGEGGELYEWRDGLLDNLESAISSGWYDETKVTSYIDKVDASIESLHEYLRSRFIAEIKDIAKNGTAEELNAALEKWDEQFKSVGDQIGVSGFGLSDEDKSWAKSVGDAKGQKETTESMWEKAMAGDRSSGTINWVMARMKQNSAAWWEADKAGDAAEKKRLADENFALGTAMGWHRKENGHWYDEYDRQVYDKGGILHGRGGIKATNRPEAVLDPDLTAKILTPTSDKQFRAFTDMMHLMFERGGRTRYDTPIIRNPSVTDSHNTSYTVNGIPIPAASAERYTVAELFRMLPMARS